MLTKPTSFRLPQAVAEALAKMPRNERSEFVREALSAAIEGHFLLPPTAMDELRAVREEMRRVGINLNQLARQSNAAMTGGAAHPSAPTLATAGAEIRAAAAAATRWLEKWRDRE